MSNIPQVAQAMSSVLTTAADKAAHQSGFQQRRSKLTGALFVQTLVLGWLKNAQASLEELTQTTAALGVGISPQGLDQRFTPAAAQCLEQVLEAGVSQLISADPVSLPVIQRFRGVYLQDSTTITLPDPLAQVWTGCGGNTPVGHCAALKLQVRLDWNTGALSGPLLQDGRAQDRSSPLQRQSLPPGGMWIADLGYFSLALLGDLAQQGVYWLSRFRVGTVVLDPAGHPWDLADLLPSQVGVEVEQPIMLGAQQRLPCRLLAQRVPPKVAQERRRRLRAQAKRKGQGVSQARLALADWTLLVTNAPVELLTLPEALVLARIRWQIELLFKLWKSQGQIDQWRSGKPWRIMCEVYAKLLAMLIQHWILLVGCWAYPNRSLTKAAQTVRSYALLLTSALAGIIALSVVIEQIARCLALGCRMNRRKAQPNAYQLLLDLADPA